MEFKTVYVGTRPHRHTFPSQQFLLTQKNNSLKPCANHFTVSINRAVRPPHLMDGDRVRGAGSTTLAKVRGERAARGEKALLKGYPCGTEHWANMSYYAGQ